MNSTTSYNRLGAKLASLLGTASLLTISQAMSAQAQQVAQAQMAQAEEAPENVLITGSLIRGATAVGVPVTNLNPQDFAMTGAVTTAELFRTVPAANVAPGPVASMSGANIERATRVNIRGLDTGDATRSLLMVDGLRVPAQGNGVCEIDPSIIPALSLDRIDILVDGASATYGSDAIAGVINIILKRNYDGAVTQLRYTTAAGGKNRYLASQLWGRTWDGGGITLAYEWYDDSPIMGNAHSNITVNFSPWGLDNRIPLQSSLPGTITNGAPSSQLGTLCTNCYAIPHGTGGNFNPGPSGIGPTAPFSNSTLNWGTFGVAANSGTNGTRNAFNPYLLSWYDAAQQRNAATMTLDQRLTKDISFYGEGWYSNRRAEYYNPAHLSPSSTNDLLVGVPTFNPYYPTGGAPTGLRVAYSMNLENPSFTDAYELADRYMGGFHIALPYGWNADLYYSQTYDSSFNHVTNAVNKNAVSAALGWTIPASLAQGTTPAIATWTKPANVPYLNLFCDATEFQCNSPTTLNYITAIRSFNEKYWINEKGLKFDGPLFDLPAGTLKAALGATYTTSTFSFVTFDNTGASSLIAPMLTDAIHRAVWAGFAELNVPVFSDQFNLPGFRKMQISASWRHDQYSDYGGTSNPKISADWMPSEDAGVTFHASWGSNFRAPGFGETSPLANNAITGWNANDLFAQTANITVNCGAPTGSGADRLRNPSTTNSLAGLVGFSGGCGASATPVGVALLGSSQTAQTAGFRTWVNQSGQVLHPEQTNNWSVGAEFAPTAFLKGLDLQATWYSIKISGVLQSFGNPTSNSFNTSSLGFSYIVPTDLAYLHAGNPAVCHNNNTPTDCPEFEQMVQGILNDGRNPVPQNILTRVQWINDGGIFNKGGLKTEGVDWSASYDFDAGDFGAWNIGMVGTYYLHQIRTFPADPIFAGNASPNAFGQETVDSFHQTVASVGNVAQPGVETLPRMHYRGRLGWSNGPFNVTGFVNYDSHFYHTQAAPPNVNGQCLSTNPLVGGGSSTCAIEGYSNIEPSYYTFDLSLGYDTGDTPANEYLRNVAVQLVIQNILDKHPPFEYRISTGGGNPIALDLLKSDQGRTISIIVTKTW
jgi:outer membrane receptor protein involved in Fe transport